MRVRTDDRDPAPGFCLSAGYLAFAGEPDVQAPETAWPTQSWPVSTAEEQGMDSASLARLIETVGIFRQDSLMIIRHGKIVAEAYYAPYVGRHQPRSEIGHQKHHQHLDGDRNKNGLLDSVDHPVLDLFSDKQIANVDDNKKAMTVQSLLDMTSGIAWQEKAYTPDETIMRMYRAPDRTEFVLNQPMSERAGGQILLQQRQPLCAVGADHQKDRHKRVRFCQEGIVRTARHHQRQMGPVDAQGVTDGEAGLSLAPQDMARIGYLYLHNGMWDGKQIIPSSWVERAKAGNVPATFRLPLFQSVVVAPRKGSLHGARPSLPTDSCASEAGYRCHHDRHFAETTNFFRSGRLIDDITRSIKSDMAMPAIPSRKACSRRRSARRDGKAFGVGATPDLAKEISGKRSNSRTTSCV